MAASARTTRTTKKGSTKTAKTASSKASRPKTTKSSVATAAAANPPAEQSERKPFLSTLKPNRLFRFVVIWAAAYLVLMSFFFNSILEKSGYVEIFPRELVTPALMHAGTALLITLAIFWTRWLKSYSAKLIAGIALALSLIGYAANLQAVSGTIRALVPGLTEREPMWIPSLIYLAILFVVAVLIGRGAEWVIQRSRRIRHQDVHLGLIVLVAYLFVVPAFSMAKIVPPLIRESRTQAPEFTKPGTQESSKDKPDIYYIVLDRYTNGQVLKDQFSFDNAPFTDFLRDNDFRVNDNAYSNYPYTAMSIASTINGQYTNKLVEPFKNEKVQSRALYHNMIQQSSVIKALKKEGYQYFSLGSWYGATYKAPLAERDYLYHQKLSAFGLDKRMRGIEAIEFEKSPYPAFAQIPGAQWWPLQYQDKEATDDVRDQLNTLDYLSTEEKPGGRFIFAHILVPHDPFAFNADGSMSTNTGTDSIGRPIKEKYTQQVQFINDQMKELVGNIQKQSKGKAVIVLNADEGAYPQFLNDTFKKPQSASGDGEFLEDKSDMRNWPNDWLKMKFGILQAAHIPKATSDDMAHLTSANVFRIILNRYAGYDLDYLPECHYGLSEGSQYEYIYADITQHLTGSTSDACKQLQSLPD